MKVKAKVKLFKHQFSFLHCKAKYPALVAGYGAGKTEAGIFRTLSYLQKNGKIFKEHGLGEYIFGVYEPTYDLIKVILFPRFETVLSSLNIKYILNKSDKILYIPSFNSRIIFRSLENDEKIIGYEHADFWIDELDTLKKSKAKSVFEKIVARNRQKKMFEEQNTGCITTTPEGYKFVYETWKKCKEKDKEKFVIIKGATLDNTSLDKQYYEDLISQYPKNLILAYTEGEFVNLNSATVYSNFSRTVNNTNINIEKYFENTKNERIIHIGMDFNVEHMAAVIAAHNEEDNELLILEEIYNVFDTPAMIRLIQERYEDYTIYIYADAAGNQRKSANASVSDIQLLRNAGFRIMNDKSNPRIKDRVMAVNSLFLNGKGDSRLFINLKECPNLVENIEQQSYDERTGLPDKSQGHDHIIDALGYLVNKLYPIRRQLHID
jgi:hypothetical protein